MSENDQTGTNASLQISIEDFERVDIRVGRILSAEPLAGARKPAYKLRIDFGAELGVRQSSAQITTLYTPEQLVGTLALAVVNFPPRRIAGFKSEVLTLGVANADGAVVLIAPRGEAPLGARLF
ncbi:MAG TPA: tRNA-binding protein [Ktedonobacterales bacterium]|jgi:tRNA-binding protein|nr:tRNA-binding protein [Ktedonobacterales bacterium]